jgi:proliferating cell nuclear antigen PCNA
MASAPPKKLPFQVKPLAAALGGGDVNTKRKAKEFDLDSIPADDDKVEIEFKRYKKVVGEADEAVEEKSIVVKPAAAKKKVMVKLKFGATMVNRTRLAKIIESIKDMVTTTYIQLSEEGILIQAMDHSQVAMVKAILTSKGFDSDSFVCEEHCQAGVDMSCLNTVLGLANPDDNVRIELSERDMDKMKFSFFSDEGSRKSDVLLALTSNTNSEFYSIPEVTPLAEITMPSADLGRIITQLQKLKEDNLTLYATPTSFHFGIKSVFLDAKLGYTEGTNIGIKWNAEDKKELKDVFSMRYLKFFIKAVSLCDQVKIQIHAANPMSIKFEFDDDEGSVCFYLAPKHGQTVVSDDEEEEDEELIFDDADGEGGGDDAVVDDDI